MMPDEVTDHDSLKVWLEGQTREVAVSVAHRAAMRAAPLFWQEVFPAYRTNRFQALDIAPPLMISGIAGTRLTPTIISSANAIYADAYNSTHGAYASEVAALAAANASYANGPAAAVYAVVNVAAAISANADIQDAAIASTNIGEDVKILEGAETGQPAAATPLWRNGENPVADAWQKVRTAWAATRDPGWHFWIDWYEAAIAGEPLLGDWDRHWNLLTDIALIDPDKWDAGPGTVNPLVAQKYEIHGLRAEADRLKRELQRAEATAATAAHRSHNQPPDLVETPSVQQYQVVLEALEDAETELAKPEPSSSRLRAAANMLLDWVKGIAVYCAELGDIALRQVAKGIGKAAVPGTVVFLAAQSEQVRQFANALLDLSSRLP